MDYNKVLDLIKLRSENKLNIKFHSNYGEIIFRNPLYKELVLLFSIRNGLNIDDENFYIGFLLNLIVYPEEYEIDEEFLGILYDVGEEIFEEFVYMDEEAFEKKLEQYEDFKIEISNFYEDYALNLKLYLDMNDEEIENLSMEDFLIKVLLVKHKIKNITEKPDNDGSKNIERGTLKKEYKDNKNWKKILERNKEMFAKINGDKK